MSRDKIGIQTCYIHQCTNKGMLMYIACLCSNLVSVHFYAIPILHFKLPYLLVLLTLGAHAQRGLRYIVGSERLFVLKILSRTQRATEVKKFVGFSNRSVQELWRETQAKEPIC